MTDKLNLTTIAKHKFKVVYIMKKCKFCQTEIEQAAKVCPTCKRSQDMHGCLLAFLIVAGILVSLMMIGMISQIGNKDSDQTSTQTNAEGQTNPDIQNKTEPTPTLSLIAVGETGNIGKLEVVISGSTESKKITADSGGFMSYSSTEGTRYIIIDISVKNINTSLENFEYSDFQLFTENGIQYSPSSLVSTGSERYFDFFEGMNPGVTEKGHIAYEVPDEISKTGMYIKNGTVKFAIE